MKNLVFVSLFLIKSYSITAQIPLPEFDSLAILNPYKNEKLHLRAVQVTDTLFDSYHGTGIIRLLQYDFNCFLNSDNALKVAFYHPNDSITVVYYFKNKFLDKVHIYAPNEVFEKPSLKEAPRLFIVPHYCCFLTKIIESYKF